MYLTWWCTRHLAIRDGCVHQLMHRPGVYPLFGERNIDAFSFILAKMVVGMEETFLLTHAFISFPISHEVIITSMLRAFLFLPCKWMTEYHQSFTVWKLPQELIAKPSSPSQFLRLVQTRIVWRHLKRICAAGSGTLLQSWHSPKFGQPLRWRRSAVQTLSWITKLKNYISAVSSCCKWLSWTMSR